MENDARVALESRSSSLCGLTVLVAPPESEQLAARTRSWREGGLLRRQAGLFEGRGLLDEVPRGL
eukprot:9136485-Pyramimonas_sp.AAC.1